MAHKQAVHYSDEPSPLDTQGLCLLSLDGGGVRGLSTLYILKGIMTRLNSHRQVSSLPSLKPCEVFDLIGGTSTGGLIAIMLGRLEMDVDECITAYSELMQTVFVEKVSRLPISLSGKVKARFDSKKLKGAVEAAVSRTKASPGEAFNDGKDRGCRTFVCATAKETAGITRLRSYTLPDESNIPASICQAALATSAATSFFDPVQIGARQFVDGALGANNPVEEVESEAANIWSSGTGELKPLVKCFVSIGTGNPGKTALDDRVLGFLSKSLVGIATETEKTERNFIARWAKHYDEKRYFRFNVDQGLQGVGLAEHKEQGRMEAVTDEYLNHQDRKFKVRDCVVNLEQKQKRTEIFFASIIMEHERRRVSQNHLTSQKLHYISFPKNRYFVGRSDELAVMRRRLLEEKDCDKITIVGLGGIGKTQLALQFAYEIREAQPEWSIFWLPAVSMESFEQACAHIVALLGLPQAGDGKDDAGISMKRYLSSDQAGPWLMIVDNADDRDMVFGKERSKGIVDYLPEREGCLTVYTTRTMDIMTDLTRGDAIELGAMGRQDATDFLTKSLARKDLLHDDATSVKQLDDLLDELTRLPLAIAQAAAYLNKNRMSIAKYLELLRGTEQDIVRVMSNEFRDSTRYTSSANAVARTWVVSFIQIQKHDSVAAGLLKFVSCVEWKAIPRSLLPLSKSDAHMEEAIGTLCGYSFLVRRDGSGHGQNGRDNDKAGADNSEEWFDMHRLVHLATQIWTNEHGDLKKIMGDAVRHVGNIFPNGHHENQHLWREYMPHALRLLRVEQACNMEERSRLCYAVGSCMYSEGRIQESVAWLEECCRLRMLSQETEEDLLSAQYTLGWAYYADGQMRNAVELLETVVKARPVEKLGAVDHPDRLTSQHTTGWTYRATYLPDVQAKKAVPLLETIVKAEEMIAVDDLKRIASQHILAVAYHATRQIKKAVELLETVVKVEETLAADHPNRLASQHELACVYYKDGQTQKAMKILEAVVRMRDKVLAEDHPSRLASQHELARMYNEDGQTQKAMKILEEVVRVRDKVLAVDNPNRLVSQYVLAVVYDKNGQTERAIHLLESVVEVVSRVWEADHPFALDSVGILAQMRVRLAGGSDAASVRASVEGPTKADSDELGGGVVEAKTWCIGR
ncbi:hypothetical protein ACEQ8H_005695 [Pleosporales sp. CAS-2024a]